jgi:hypothetical protein
MTSPTKILLDPPPAGEAREQHERIKCWARAAGGWSADAFVVVVNELADNAPLRPQRETLIAVFLPEHRVERFVLPLPAGALTRNEVQQAVGLRFIPTPLHEIHPTRPTQS